MLPHKSCTACFFDCYTPKSSDLHCRCGFDVCGPEQGGLRFRERFSTLGCAEHQPYALASEKAVSEQGTDRWVAKGV